MNKPFTIIERNNNNNIKIKNKHIDILMSLINKV